ncbi:hypothetical protein C1645_734897 [Glomus cerebriforme]|uniref:Uncharacterized protein n=1 Tax=Glomus cerebriforme TaxID=658196 RepID=A0A397TAE4_9GLOM|nr:hypothetical protein C1645_734897 [Glomus cerebriforme]
MTFEKLIKEDFNNIKNINIRKGIYYQPVAKNYQSIDSYIHPNQLLQITIANRHETLDYYPNLYRKFSGENFDNYGITDEISYPLCKLDHSDEESIEGNMSESNKILTPEYLNWHAKLTGLPRVLTNKIHFNLYKKYKRETGLEP